MTNLPDLPPEMAEKAARGPQPGPVDDPAELQRRMRQAIRDAAAQIVADAHFYGGPGLVNRARRAVAALDAAGMLCPPGTMDELQRLRAGIQEYVDGVRRARSNGAAFERLARLTLDAAPTGESGGE